MRNSNLDLHCLEQVEAMLLWSLTWLVIENIVKQLKLKATEEHPKVTPTAASLDAPKSKSIQD